MKRLFVVAFPLLLCGVALAQPDPNPRGMVENPPEANLGPAADPRQFPQATPVGAARFFWEALIGKSELNLTMAVYGARVGYYGSEELINSWSETSPLTTLKYLKLDNVAVEAQTEDEATIIVTYHPEYGEEQGKAVQQKILLRRDKKTTDPMFFGQQNIWRVVPLSTEELLAKPLNTFPLLQLGATSALRDSSLLTLLQLQSGISRLKQLGLGVLQFTQDYDEIYAFDDAARERAIRPYIKNDTLFLIPGTRDEKWRFNDNLSSKPLTAINELSRQVVFYDGSAPDNEHLNFRFDGKTLIGFADGHVSALTQDKVEKLVWKP